VWCGVVWCALRSRHQRNRVLERSRCENEYEVEALLTENCCRGQSVSITQALLLVGDPGRMSVAYYYSTKAPNPQPQSSSFIHSSSHCSARMNVGQSKGLFQSHLN